MTTADRVKRIVSSQLQWPLHEVKPLDKLADDLGADSLDIVELRMYLEDEFRIELEDEDIGKLTTLGELIAFMEQRLPDEVPAALMLP